MIKKPISPNLDHSNRFLIDYVLQNFAFTYAYVATPGARFSKVPIINGPGKLSPFTLKIEVSIVLHLA